MFGRLILEDGTEMEGKSFGYESSVAGEVVFSTGMVGYPESLTDPSYAGQILTYTYPLVGNYGVAHKEYWESKHIHVTALIVSNYIETPSHFLSNMSLSDWLKKEKIPALEIKDTRGLTLKLREKGVMLGKIVITNDELLITNKKKSEIRKTKLQNLPATSYQLPAEFYDPNTENLVAKVSQNEVTIEGNGKKTVVLFDCGAKRNIQRCLLRRGVKLITVPWDLNIFQPIKNYELRIKNKNSTSYELQAHLNPDGTLKFDAIVVSNGPGDPKMADKTIATVSEALKRKIPTFGVCLGNQILALAAGGDTYKLKFGHRSQNQPCIQVGTKRCYLTTQNHGFAVGKIPKGFKAWFINANDGTNEGIIHEKLPFMSVQFHPEAAAGPVDTEWLFDYFLDRV